MSMVLFSKWINFIYHAYRGVINFKKLFVEEWIVLWIIVCSVLWL